jgi:hypothetical protein
MNMNRDSGVAQHLRPQRDRRAIVLMRMVGRAEGDDPRAVLRQARRDRMRVGKRHPPECDPALGQGQRLFDQQVAAGRRGQRVADQIVDGGEPYRVRITQPACLDRRRAPRHHLDLVHVGRAAELDQHVELVVGDHLCRVARVGRGRDAIGRRGLCDQRLRRVDIAALEERVAVELEPLRVGVLEQRQGEVAHRMIAQVGGQEA